MKFISHRRQCSFASVSRRSACEQTQVYQPWWTFDPTKESAWPAPADQARHGRDRRRSTESARYRPNWPRIPTWPAKVIGTMWRIRLFEEAVDELFARGLMHGTMHLSIGQEASATGVCLAMREGDHLTSTHRGHGHCIGAGADLNRMMAELLAKETGYCRGRGGSMHIADVSTGNLGANGIVGGGIPIAAGAALGLRLQGKTDAVVVSFFGDGASNEGAFHEGLNLAAVWDLPVVFVCENNKYGMSMSTELSTRIANLAERAAGYGIAGVSVDGNDVQAVYEAATRRSSARAAAAGRPSSSRSPTGGRVTPRATRTSTALARRSRSGGRRIRSPRSWRRSPTPAR